MEIGLQEALDTHHEPAAAQYDQFGYQYGQFEEPHEQPSPKYYQSGPRGGTWEGTTDVSATHRDGQGEVQETREGLRGGEKLQSLQSTHPLVG